MKKMLYLIRMVALAGMLFWLPTATTGAVFKAPKLGTAEARVGGGRRGAFKAPKLGTAAARVGGGRRGWAPPKLGTAAARVGGGRRGWAAPKLDGVITDIGVRTVGEERSQETHVVPEGSPEIWVLTPANTGLTVSASPSLYYYLSDNTGMDLDVTINLDRKTILHVQISTPKKKGIYRVSLAELGVELEEGKEYELNVVLVQDRSQGSLNITSSGMILRVPLEENLELLLRQNESKRYEAYAENGIWYEALHELNKEILSRPDNTDLKSERSGLLRQVGLPEVAEMINQ